MSDTWKEFSDGIGARFDKGKDLTDNTVVSQVRNWTIILDTVKGGPSSYGPKGPGVRILCTQMGVYYVNKDGFRFRIYRKGIMRKLGDKLVGVRDIEVGDPEFDNKFIIKGNDKSKVRALFSNSKIRQLIQSQPFMSLEIRHNLGFAREVDQLYFCENGIIEDLERLKCLYQLFIAILDHLCRTGSASEEEPTI